MPFSASIQVRLQHQHETLPELVQECTEEQLKQPVIAGKWSAFEQVVHLVTYQPVFLQRIQKTETGVNPAFERYVADNDPAFSESCNKTLTGLLQQLEMQRNTIIRHLFSIPENKLRYTARHPIYGEMAITGWTEFFLLHEAHHLFNIFMLVHRLRAKP